LLHGSTLDDFAAIHLTRSGLGSRSHSYVAIRVHCLTESFHLLAQVSANPPLMPPLSARQ